MIAGRENFERAFLGIQTEWEVDREEAESQRHKEEFLHLFWIYKKTGKKNREICGGVKKEYFMGEII